MVVPAIHRAPRGATGQNAQCSQRTCRCALQFRGQRTFMAASPVGLRAQVRPPGTEFLDAETERQKSPAERANAHRDKNPGTE
jgi:hypothetical protein